MTKRNRIFLLVVCSSFAFLVVQSFSQPRRIIQAATLSATEHQRNMTDAEKDREYAKKREQRKFNREKRRKEWEKEKEEAGGFIFEKYALRTTEEQWEVIKAKLEKVRYFRDKARSTPRLGLTSSSGSGTGPKSRTSRSVPTWQWGEPWKDKDSSELTAAQKLTKQLIALIETKDTTPEQFRRTMDALRKARHEEAKIQKQLSEAQQELRKVLTTRQEAALVLMRWL